MSLNLIDHNQLPPESKREVASLLNRVGDPEFTSVNPTELFQTDKEIFETVLTIPGIPAIILEVLESGMARFPTWHQANGAEVSLENLSAFFSLTPTENQGAVYLSTWQSYFMYCLNEELLEIVEHDESDNPDSAILE